MAARLVALTSTKAGWAAMCAETAGLRVAPPAKRARYCSDSGEDESDGSEEEEEGSTSSDGDDDALPPAVDALWMGWSEAQLTAAREVIPRFAAPLLLVPGLEMMPLADTARFLVCMLGTKGRPPTNVRAAAGLADRSRAFRAAITQLPSPECGLVPCRACSRAPGGDAGVDCSDAKKLYGFVKDRFGNAERPTQLQVLTWPVSGLSLCRAGLAGGIAHDRLAFTRPCSRPPLAADVSGEEERAAREAAWDALRAALRVEVDRAGMGATAAADASRRK